MSTALYVRAEESVGLTLPVLIAGAGERAAWRFVEFFTVNIRNPHTRSAYSRAAGTFLRCCCEGHGIGELAGVQPVHVAAYIKGLQTTHAAPTVKQHLACIRMLFDWLVTGQVVPSNPAHAVRGPRHSVTRGKTPVLTSEEASTLVKEMKVHEKDGSPYVVGLRDRAIIAVMTYTFAHVGAVVGLTLEYYYIQKKHHWLRLHEKNGKVNEMPCHPKLAVYLDEYLAAAGVAGDRKDSPLSRSAIGKTKKLTRLPLVRTDAWRMEHRRASDAGIETPIGCHTFRATGITDYLTHNGRIEDAQRVAGHSNAKWTGPYDRRGDDVDLSEVAKIGI